MAIKLVVCLLMIVSQFMGIFADTIKSDTVSDLSQVFVSGNVLSTEQVSVNEVMLDSDHALDMRVTGNVDMTSILVIENEFIKCVVNDNQADRGHFAIETTQGDPKHDRDNNQVLIFSRPVPWTSYTTILIDGEPYLFGGASSKLNKRSGKIFRSGHVLSQFRDDEQVVTHCDFGKVQVIQTLRLYRNPSTRVKDMVLISYAIKNNDVVSHNVGVRLMLDTKLGSNDGAPFRIGSRSVTSELHLKGEALFDYWQTFDDLVSPNIVAQGIFRLPNEQVFPPDDLYLVNWGKVADYIWNFPYYEGRSFIREGEFENDTALAMYWDSQTISVNGSREVKTLYGLGGLSLQSGQLSLGLTAPAETYVNNGDDILVMGYILNSGGFDSLETWVDFVIPSGFRLVEGQSSQNLGLLAVGEMRQIPLKLKMAGANVGKKTIKMKVSSKTLASNQTQRQIDCLLPPRLHVSLDWGERTLSERSVHYYPVLLTLENQTTFPIRDIQATLNTVKGVVVPFFDLETKTLDSLYPGRKKQLNWKLRKVTMPVNQIMLNTVITSKTTAPKKMDLTQVVRQDRVGITLLPSQHVLTVGDYFYVDVFSLNRDSVSDFNLKLSYSMDKVSYCRYSVGTHLRDSSVNMSILSDRDSLLFTGGPQPKSLWSRPLFRIHFRAISDGDLKVNLRREDAILDTLKIVIK